MQTVPRSNHSLQPASLCHVCAGTWERARTVLRPQPRLAWETAMTHSPTWIKLLAPVRLVTSSLQYEVTLVLRR